MTVRRTIPAVDRRSEQVFNPSSFYNTDTSQSVALATYLEHLPEEVTCQNFHTVVGDHNFIYEDLDQFQVFPMAVEHKMADVNTTWQDVLKKIASSLDWTYAVLWARSDDGRNLTWKQGYFHTRRIDDAELFYHLYSKCRFAPGFGIAGQLERASDRILWLTGDTLELLPNRVPDQTCFLRAAGIQTVACVPLDLPSSSFVIEVGSVLKILENETLGQDIKNYLLHIRAGGLELIIRDSPVSDVPAESRFEFGLAMEEASAHGSLSPQAPGIEIGMDSATSAAMNLYSADPATAAAMDLLVASHRHTQSSIYSELLQPLDQEDSFLGQSSRISTPQIPVGLPDLPASSGLSSRERFEAPWPMEPSLLPMSPYHSWVATSTMDTAMSGINIPSTSSGTSTQLGGPAIDVSDERSPLQQLIETTRNSQRHQNMEAGSRAGDVEAVRQRSPSSSPSTTRRSQTRDDRARSAAKAILDTYEKFGVPGLETISGIQVSGVATAVAGSSSTLPTETESYSWGGVHPSSEPSSKETSPESTVPITHTGFGIRPAIDIGSSSHSEAQRSLLRKEHSRAFSPGAAASQRSERLEQPSSAGLQQAAQERHADSSRMKSVHSPTDPADSAPMLVQFGNVLQLGNASGQVTEALPQEHDEAAVSHMLAERRRRNKQNENFTQLKSLIPAAAKMDKASLLAATITYIKELKDRVTTLEQNNDTLRRQLEQHPSPKEGLRRLSSRGKGSPPKAGGTGRGFGHAPPSYTDADRIQVTPDGDGNLTIEMRCPSSQLDSPMVVLGCLKDMHFKDMQMTMDSVDNWIYATITVKTKRKNTTGQSEVCAEVEQALKRCLNLI